MVNSRLMSFLLTKCPKCREGSIFYPTLSGPFSMNDTCSECGLKFEREPGYFTGAMPVSYVIGFLLMLPIALFLIVTEARILWLILLPTALLALCSPFIFRYSRTVWLYLDRNVDRSGDGSHG